MKRNDKIRQKTKQKGRWILWDHDKFFIMLWLAICIYVTQLLLIIAGHRIKDMYP